MSPGAASGAGIAADDARKASVASVVLSVIRMLLMIAPKREDGSSKGAQ